MINISNLLNNKITDLDLAYLFKEYKELNYLDNYVTSLILNLNNNQNDYDIAYYDPFFKEIIYYRTNYLKKINNLNSININYNELIVLFHELNHVKQYKVMKEDETTLQRIYEINYNLMDNSSFYIKNHDLFSIEIESKTLSRLEIINRIQNNFNEELLYEFINEYFEELLKYYSYFLDFSYNPLEFLFYKDLHNNNYLELDDLSKELDLFNRIHLGLKISKEEYFYLKELKNKYLNYQINCNLDIKKLILK